MPLNSPEHHSNIVPRSLRFQELSWASLWQPMNKIQYLCSVADTFLTKRNENFSLISIHLVSTDLTKWKLNITSHCSQQNGYISKMMAQREPFKFESHEKLSYLVMKSSDFKF